MVSASCFSPTRKLWRELYRKPCQNPWRNLCRKLWPSILLLVTLLPAISQASFTASVDRNTISEQDIISLTLRSTDGQVADQIDLSALEQDFSILNRKQSNKLSLINGQRSSVNDYILIIAPNRSGVLTVPSFSFKGNSTQPIKVRVSAGPADPKQALSEVFLDNEVTKQEVYVQEQFFYRLRIFHSTGLDEPRLSPPEIANAVVKQLGEQKNYEQIVNGVRYSIVEINYSVIPESSGRLIIPEQTLTARTVPIGRNIFRSNGRLLRVKSATQIINVLPKPESYPNDRPWLPTPELVLEDSWAQITPQLRAGNPTTRTITMSAKGLSAAQLPNLELQAIPGLKIYPDQPSLDDQVTAEGNRGIRSVAAAVVPSQEGFLEFPGLDLVWWNTNTNQLEKSIIPAQKLRVLPPLQEALNSQLPPVTFNDQIASTDDHDMAENQKNQFVWPVLTTVFALLWLITLWRLMRNRKRPTNYVASAEEGYKARIENRYGALKKLKRAISERDYSQTRQSLIDWFKAVYPDHSIENLDDIRRLDCHPEIDEQIMALQAQLYGDQGGSTDWSAEKLLGILEQIRRSTKKQSLSSSAKSLKPLYPL